MNGLNSLIIEGNMVRDPEFKETAKGTSFCSFSIATNRVYIQNNETMQEVSYFDVEAWTSMALLCKENGSRGRGVRVVGRLKQDRWVGKDGKNYSKVKVVAEHIEFKPKFTSSKTKKRQALYAAN
ncbi:MAG: single-stranded DNA-binding protein [Treponema sp.]